MVQIFASEILKKEGTDGNEKIQIADAPTWKTRGKQQSQQEDMKEMWGRVLWKSNRSKRRNQRSGGNANRSSSLAMNSFLNISVSLNKFDFVVCRSTYVDEYVCK